MAAEVTGTAKGGCRGDGDDKGWLQRLRGWPGVAAEVTGTGRGGCRGYGDGQGCLQG